MSSAPSPVPKRGEVWKVNFDPTVGTEIRKTRPAIIIVLAIGAVIEYS